MNTLLLLLGMAAVTYPVRAGLWLRGGRFRHG